MGYFVKRKLSGPIDYEINYWGPIVDPDGIVRNRLNEREQYLDDVKHVIDFLRKLTPGRILDIGCGLGFLLSSLGEGWEKHGTEVSRFASQHAKRWGEIYVGELADAQFPNDHFDVVVLYHVIEHMEDPVNTIIEVRRILKPGGIIILGTPDFDSGCARLFKENYRLLHDNTHVSLFTNESIYRFLRDHGFIIDHVEYPFFETRYFTPENLMRLFDTSKISPPFYGNFMTFYCCKPIHSNFYQTMMNLSRVAVMMAENMADKIELAGDMVVKRLRSHNKILVCGNGGSAADAQHFVGELVGHMGKERPSLPAISLSSDPLVVRALGNDYGYEYIFSRQVEGLGQMGDILIAISTSGRSPNILQALVSARKKGLYTIALTGEDSKSLSEECDLCINVPSGNTQRIQEAHMAVLHAICESVDLQM